MVCLWGDRHRLIVQKQFLTSTVQRNIPATSYVVEEHMLDISMSLRLTQVNRISGQL